MQGSETEATGVGTRPTYSFAPGDSFYGSGAPDTTLSTVYDVQDFLAPGAQSTDARSGIQAAIDAAAAAGGGVVYLPAGVYVVTKSPTSDGAIDLPSNVFIKGDGEGQTVIQVADGNVDEIEGVIRSKADEHVVNAGVADLTIDGNKANQVDPNAQLVDGVYLGGSGSNESATDIDLLRVTVADVSGYGFDINEGASRIAVEDGTASAADEDGFVIEGATDSTFTNILAENSDRHGVNIRENSQNIVLLNATASGNEENGVYVSRGGDAGDVTTNILIDGGTFDGNGRNGVEVTEASDVIVRDATISNNDKSGVLLKGASNVTVEDNEITDNSQQTSVSAPTQFDGVTLRESDDTAITGRIIPAEDNLVRNNLITSSGEPAHKHGVREKDGEVANNLADGNIVLGQTNSKVKMIGEGSQSIVDTSYTPPSWFFEEGEPTAAELSGSDVFDVTDFGAVADPDIDSTAAIQAAIDAAYENGGGVVYLPPGVYGIASSDYLPGKSGSLYLQSNVYMKGAGMEYASNGGVEPSSSIRLVDGSSDFISGLIRTSPSEGTFNYGVADLTIDGNRANTTNDVIAVLTGVKPQNGDGIPDQDVLFLRTEAKDHSSYGFDPHEITVNITIQDSVAHGNGLDGFVADYLVDSEFKNNIAFDNDRHGFNVTTTATNFKLTDNIAYGNGGSGATLQRGNFDIPIVSDVTISGGEYYDNAGEGIVVRMSDDVTITGVHVHDNGKYGVRVKGSTDVTIDNNVIEDNGQLSAGSYSNIQILEEFDPITSSTFASTGTVITNNELISSSGQLKYGVEERIYDPVTSPDSVDNTFIGANNSFTGTYSREAVELVGASSVWLGTSATEGPDVYTGDSDGDLFDGLGGDDTISGTAGDDTLFGGAGDDVIDGGTGQDSLYGGSENDRLLGSSNFDFLDGGVGDDTIYGGSGNDTIILGAGADSVGGGTGTDTFLVALDDSVDDITGGSGYDILDYGSSAIGVTIDMSSKTVRAADQNLTNPTDVFRGIEEVVGSGFDDELLGLNSAGDRMSGGDGADFFRGRGGDDQMSGGAGNDTYFWFKSDVVSGATIYTDEILDFEAGDVLDFRELVKNETYADPSEVVQTTTVGSDTTVSAKIDGVFVEVVTLTGVTSVPTGSIEIDDALFV